MNSLIKKVKVTFPFKKPDIENQLPFGKHHIGDFQFDINPEKPAEEVYDYWVVYENLHSPVEYSLLKGGNNTIFITGEPPAVKKYSSAFLKQFDLIITSHEIIKHPNVLLIQQALPWSINKNYNELISTEIIPKTKFMSVITSNKTLTDGHKKRLDFALKLQSLYPEYIDLYGRGINDFENKWDVLAPYKYHVCIENSSIRNYFTEKITDSFLCLSFPLYHGCTNIESYFNENSFIEIDINKIDSCKKVIDRLLTDSSHYDNNLLYLREARMNCLDKYNLFPFLKAVIEKRIQNPVEDIEGDSCRKRIYQAPVDMVKFYLKRFKH